MIAEVRPRPFIGGLLSFVPGAYAMWDRLRPMGDYRPPEYGSNVLHQRLQEARDAGLDVRAQAVLELGPGRSLSAPIAALLEGAERAIGVDAVPYANRSANLAAFDALAAEAGVSGDRMEELRQAVANAGLPGRETKLRYVAPWSDPTIVATDSIDFVFSVSVLEHVTDPAAVYRSCFRWLRSGGAMAHRIDHSSHGITRHWNGHYWVADWLWRLVLGGRPYAINRWTPDDHRAAAEAAGFEVASLNCVPGRNEDAPLYRRPPAGRFANMPREHLFVATSTMVLKES